MKKVLAITLTLALTFCLLAIPTSAASRKFYIPQKIVEYNPNGGTDGNTPETKTYRLSYDSASKVLTVQGDTSAALLRFLQNESTDNIANRFLAYDFDDVATDATCDRFFANDLIRYGKIQKINYFDSNQNKVAEDIFKTQNNKVTYCSQRDYSTVSDVNIDHYQYNKDGNISQIQNKHYQIVDAPGEPKNDGSESVDLTAKINYDSNKRLKQITVTSNNNSNYKINYSNYQSNGLPRTVRVAPLTKDDGVSHMDRNYSYSFNSQNQLIKINDSIFIMTNSYDSQNRLAKITDNEGKRYTYSDFIKI